MRQIKSIITYAAIVLLIGCTQQRDPSDVSRISALEADINTERSISDDLRTQLSNMTVRLEAEERSSASALETLKAQLVVQSQQINSMSQTIQRGKAYVAQLRGQAARPQTTSVVSPNPLYADFIHTPVGSNPDLYPISVFNVSGKKALTGTRNETYWDKNEVVRRDSYGNRISSSGEWDQRTVKEFEYQVTFSVKNLTKTTKIVRIDAGKSSRDISLPPGGSLENQVIDAVVGSPLNATVAGQTRPFNVSR